MTGHHFRYQQSYLVEVTLLRLKSRFQQSYLKTHLRGNFADTESGVLSILEVTSQDNTYGISKVTSKHIFEVTLLILKSRFQQSYHEKHL